MAVLAPIGGLIGGVLLAFRLPGGESRDNTVADAVVLSGLVIGGVSVSSFVYGMVNTSRCRRAYRERGITPPDELD